MKIGDKVRFLSEVGGGTVAGFQGKDIVLVEDADGFQIPTAINDVVVVGDDDYSTSRIIADKKKSEQKANNGKPTMTIANDDEDYDPADRPVTFKAPAEERKGGDKLSAYLAFVPMDPKALSSSRFETYFINDSNYYMHIAYMVAEGASWTLRYTGETEPNTKMYIEELGREDLSMMEHVAVQVIAYKRKKSFIQKPVVDVDMRIDPVKFYKLHTFEENDFFEQKAYIVTIIENDQPARPLVIDAKRLKQEMMQKVQEDSKPNVSPARKAQEIRQMREDKNAPLVIDLHAHALLETTAGMSPADILNYQLETMRKTIREHEKEKGKKIVFIHGKGEGVLRHAIVNELRYRFKNLPYQDASFQEYGYGATQVTIR